jgi:hypothetical protein
MRACGALTRAIVGAHALVQSKLPDYAIADAILATMVHDRRAPLRGRRSAAVADMFRKAAAALQKAPEA